MNSQELPPEQRDGLRRLAERCRDADVAVLSGAGISAPSGVATFRGEGGVWRRHRAEELASPEGFARDPQLVWDWYGERREKLRRVEPNAAHHALVRLATRSKSLRIITQNVDGLHGAADPGGEIEMVELHGNIWRTRCTSCGRIEENRAKIPDDGALPHCDCGALLRPDVVWFGEALDPDHFRRAAWIAANCEILLVVGTSGVVMPAAAIADMAEASGAEVAVFDLHETPIARRAHFLGDCAQILPILADQP